MISSCPVELPKRLGWLKSGRFLRLLSILGALVLLSAILYNAIAVDRIPPTYTIRVSNTTSTGLAPTLMSIDVDFSEAVRHDTAEKAFSMTAVVAGSPAVAGTFYWQGQTLIFTPSAKLPLSTKFHVRIAAGVQDLAGNAQGSSSSIDFTTVGGPVVVSASPASGAGSVPVDASIEIQFDRLMDTQKVIAGLTVQPAITYQASWNGPLLTINPIGPMEYGTTYTVKIGDPAVDQDGTRLAPYVTSFKTVGSGLRVTGLIPAPDKNGISIHSEIAVTFDSPIDLSSIAGAIKITPPISGSIKAISLPGNSSAAATATGTATATATSTPGATAANAIVFTPDNPLSPNTTYFVTLSSTVRRTDGQVASGRTWTFITGAPPANALNHIAFISHRSGVDNVWLMNPDGSNQRQVTAELEPVSSYDISGDGTTIAYGVGGVVKKMSVSGNNLTTLTSGGNSEYAPTITPDGTGLIVARRDASDRDMGYWLYPLVSGADTKQVAPDGALDPAGVKFGADGLTGQPGMPAWAPRAALTSDGATMLVVRGADDIVELVAMNGAAKPTPLTLQGNSRPVWVESDGAFYLAGSDDKGATWACWRVTPSGSMTKIGAATSDIAATDRSLAVILRAADGSSHLAYAPTAGGPATPLTDDPSLSESAPSFSPDGSAVAFGRVNSQSPVTSAGIWEVNVDGTGLTNLSLDGSSPRWIA